MKTALFFLLFCRAAAGAAEPDIYTYRILATHAHSTASFTQGLFTEGDWIYESAGGYGQSRLLRYHKLTGQVDTEFKLPPQLFAEGSTLFRDSVYLLTWKAGLLLQFSARQLKPLRQTRYKGEGWGLTHDGDSLIMSDGSDRLYFRDPGDFSIRRTITVRDAEKSWDRLNELEFALGKIWANVWGDNRILVIDPADGRVAGIADLSILRRGTVKTNNRNVLNGIAYDPEKKAFWITGKNWPKRFLMEFTARPRPVSKDRK